MIVDIQPVTSLGDTGVKLQFSINDNCIDKCTVSWDVLDVTNQRVTAGTIIIGGIEYANWSGSNVELKNIVLTKLQLTQA